MHSPEDEVVFAAAGEMTEDRNRWRKRAEESEALVADAAALGIRQRTPLVGGWAPGDPEPKPRAYNARAEAAETERDEALAKVATLKTRAAGLTNTYEGKRKAWLMEDETKRTRIAALEATIEPVRDWYDGEGDRDVVEMLQDAIADLQQDRARVIALGSG